MVKFLFLQTLRNQALRIHFDLEFLLNLNSLQGDFLSSIFLDGCLTEEKIFQLTLLLSVHWPYLVEAGL